MGRKAKPLHQLQLQSHGSRAVCYWRSIEWDFGHWDAEKDAPTPEASLRFRQQLAAWQLNPAAGFVESGNRFLIELWNDWVAAVPSKRPGDVRRCSLLLFGTSCKPGPYLRTTVGEFGKPQLAEWRDGLCKLRNAKGEPRFGRFMVNLYVGFVQQCFAWAEERGTVSEERVASLLRVKKAGDQAKAPVKRRGVVWERIEATLPHLTAPLQLAVQLLWLTGARPSEVLQLRAESIQRKGTIVTESGTPVDLDKHGVWGAALDTHKTDGTDYDRVLFFGPKAQLLLAPLLDRSGPLFKPAEGVRLKDKIVGAAHKRNDVYDARALARAIRRVCARLDQLPWSPYQIRHRVFRLVQTEHGRDAARVFGGHCVGGATENYAGSDLNTAARVAAAWG